MTLTHQKKELITRWTTTHLITDQRVITAFLTIPREHFIPKHLRKHAYEDNALPFLKGQTISQPTTVMIMTQALDVQEGDRILEIGTGSGYQAALLSKLTGPTGTVTTTEIIPELAAYATRTLKDYTNVHVIHTDGSGGYATHAPYHKILITAATPTPPLHLTTQLTEEGIIVAPVGGRYDQILYKITKHKNTITHEHLGHFLFVPLTGKHGFQEENL